MTRFKIRMAMIGAMALVALSAFTLRTQAQGADALKLESVDVQTLSSNQVQLKLHLSGPAPEPLPFTIDKPARIAFDLPNTSLALPSRRIDVRSGGVDSVLAAEANGRSRLVVNVDQLLPVHDQGRRQHHRRDPGPPAGRRPGECRRPQCRRRRRVRRALHQDHRFPPRLRRHRPRDRAALRSAHAGQRAAGRQSGRGRLRGHADAQEPDAPLRRHGFRDAGADRRCDPRRGQLAPRDQRAGRFRATGLSVGQSVHRRDQALPEARPPPRRRRSTPASA